jgi:ribA/ribD-fused uncharacterized protein
MDWQAEDGTVQTSCAVFYRVTEEFGGLSNMAGGYPLRINGISVGSSEALYQACRFPHQPDWQREIITQASPMAAKMKARKERRRQDHSRLDWGQIDVAVMRWVLRVKLAQHFDRIAGLLRRSSERAIVEMSRKDRFWGAVEEEGRLHGRNQLGLLLMELRERVRTAERAELETVEPPGIPDFLLLGQPIGVVQRG